MRKTLVTLLLATLAGCSTENTHRFGEYSYNSQAYEYLQDFIRESERKNGKKDITNKNYLEFAICADTNKDKIITKEEIREEMNRIIENILHQKN